MSKFKVPVSFTVGRCTTKFLFIYLFFLLPFTLCYYFILFVFLGERVEIFYPVFFQVLVIDDVFN